MRKLLAQNQAVDEKRLKRLLDSYLSNLRNFAEISGKHSLLQRIQMLSEQLESSREEILESQEELRGVDRWRELLLCRARSLASESG
jgi:hypothetical protein